jgi:hypothetical protein
MRWWNLNARACIEGALDILPNKYHVGDSGLLMSGLGLSCSWWGTSSCCRRMRLGTHVFCTKRYAPGHLGFLYESVITFL